MDNRLSEPTKRVAWIDISKAIAIYLMVLGPTGVSAGTNIIIHAFHMQVFFILSGYSFNEKKYRQIGLIAKKRFFSLIIPYLIFATVLFFLWNLALYILNRPAEMRPVLNLVSSMLWINTEAAVFGVIQWFLPCMFFSELLLGIICRLSRASALKTSAALLVLSIIAYACPRLLGVRLPWALDCALMAAVFSGVGWLARGLDLNKFAETLKKHLAAAWFAVVLVALIASPLIFINGEVSIRTVLYGNYFLFFLNSFIYSAVVIMLSMLLDSTLGALAPLRFAAWIGRHTLVVLLLNSTAIRFWKVLSEQITAQMSSTQIYAINSFVAFIIMLICVAASAFINRFFPILLGRKNSRNGNPTA